MLTALVAGDISALLRLARSPGAVGAGLAGLAAGEDQWDLAGWSAEDVPDLAVRRPGWTVQTERLPRSRRKAALSNAQIRDLLDTAVVTAADTFAGHVLATFPQAAREWAVRLDEQAAQLMHQSADWFRSCLENMPSNEDLAAAAGLLTRFTAIQAALDDPEPSADEDFSPAKVTAPTVTTSAAAGDCVVCDQMQETLTGYIFAGQFRLATREDEQERHTLGGGFCPLHTWQYASVASPLGISSGYAKLATAVADALDKLSRRDVPASELSRAVASLVAGPGDCPVCATLADRERIAITEIVSCRSPAPATLCLRHLALVLSAGVDPRTGQALLRSLAASLRRDTEDMRAFALKREAYRGGLVNSEESRAYQNVLRRLAGLSALSRPWTDEESARM